MGPGEGEGEVVRWEEKGSVSGSRGWTVLLAEGKDRSSKWGGRSIEVESSPMLLQLLSSARSKRSEGAREILPVAVDALPMLLLRWGLSSGAKRGEEGMEEGAALLGDSSPVLL